MGYLAQCCWMKMASISNTHSIINTKIFTRFIHDFNKKEEGASIKFSTDWLSLFKIRLEYTKVLEDSCTVSTVSYCLTYKVSSSRLLHPNFDDFQYFLRWRHISQKIYICWKHLHNIRIICKKKYEQYVMFSLRWHPEVFNKYDNYLFLHVLSS